MAVKLNKSEQRELDVVVARMKGLRVALGAIAEDLGKAELNMWKTAQLLSKGKKVTRIDHDSAKAKLILEEDL